MSAAENAAAQPFFLPREDGQRFCMYHPPAGVTCRGAILYVHPFAEEMNRSRRMAALAARALAAHGYGVLQIDLHGCADSSGDFGDARWHAWKADLQAGCAWLQERLGQPVTLWGLRLGALLALDYAATAAVPPARLLLWQPVISGAAYITQFLRLRIASDMLGGEPTGAGTDALRVALAGGEVLEIAGYDLAPALAAAIDGADATKLVPIGIPVDWFEIVASAERPASQAAERTTFNWRLAGARVNLQAVAGPPFWSTPEMTESAALIEASCRTLLEEQ
ncbi:MULTISPECIES: hydrolase 2, exosortase A system-associated [unclassified Massilia]|uniref:hydrolase 2, exosortase A system-associated n=1 Tax=unclassified Massilia TaxID=2609279 RepID=UPI0017864ED0|nr:MULTISPECIES: hydrolase 2, exosortase A system-associated [unclassified Massilia]MBD8531340.1 hydrolase 2, exosortase A system-associated [Massilia sp. CFBP 13647]MBD8674405.1 hydrolase 2, exosortase A system-associated [Massilia sp. CFBP 13721]